ncbi:MAG: hypothetical protein ACREHG_05790 [Candidatus Saccharimonadales bacterium]
MGEVTCLLCDTKFAENILNHIRLMHPEQLDELILGEMALLSSVTRAMNDEDWVCDNCDTQFAFGQLFGQWFEGMVGDQPIASLVCGKCFMAGRE